MTLLILWIAFASVFCGLLGFTRVPYAAAAQGQFFSSFGRLHPKRGFPAFSVVAMGLIATAACLLSLGALIRMLVVIQIVTQFAAQCVGLLVIRRCRPHIARPFKMPLYPAPVLIALAGWTFILCSSGAQYVWTAFAVMAGGVLAYLWRAHRLREWPFEAA